MMVYMILILVIEKKCLFISVANYYVKDNLMKESGIIW